jgi:Glycerophosphoryl diester phosphodiesterase family
VLEARGYRRGDGLVFIQSFEVGNLKDLSEMTRLPLVQLVNEGGRPYDFTVSGDPRTYADLVTPVGLAEIATYARGIGVSKNLIVPRDSANRLEEPTDLVEEAHRAGLLVHAWTFRNENTFLPEDFRQGNAASPVYLRATGNAPAEYKLFYDLGIDGLFSDNPDTALAVRGEVFAKPGARPKTKEPILRARAILPSDAYQPGPPSGAFIGPNNGVTPPFPGQPIPGFSAVLDAGRGEFWAMPGNGFGAKTNSGDFLLWLYRIRPDFETDRGGSGSVDVLSFLQLRDPEGHVPSPSSAPTGC